MKLNLERLEIFTDIAKTHCQVINVKRDLADAIYSNGHGISAHALAMKIYNADAETEYNDEECRTLLQFVQQLCSPALIDAIEAAINQHNEQ